MTLQTRFALHQMSTKLTDISSNFTPWLSHFHHSFDHRHERATFYLLAAYDVVAGANWRINMPSQPWEEFWLVRNGKCNITSGEYSFQATTGTIVLLREGELRLTRNSSGDELSIIGFSYRYLLDDTLNYLAMLDAPRYLHPSSQTLQSIHQVLNELITKSQNTSHAPSLSANALAEQALQITLDYWLEHAGLKSTFEERLQQNIQRHLSPDLFPVLSWIEQHYEDPTTLNQLASLAHLSPKHFARKFKATLGKTPMEYLRLHRLRHAANLLATDSADITHIAQRCGFDNVAHFSRLFKNQYGLPPLAFRRHKREFG